MARTLRCVDCSLYQFPRNPLRCRRCRSSNFEVAPDKLFGTDKLPTVTQVTRRLMLEALLRCNGSGLQAAKMIGMSKSRFYRMMPKRMNDGNKQAKANRGIPARAEMGPTREERAAVQDSEDAGHRGTR